MLKQWQFYSFFLYAITVNAELIEHKEHIMNTDHASFTSTIFEKIEHKTRITPQEALELYTNVPIGTLGQLADKKRESISGNNIYYIKNIHIEPTNICQNKCKFCSYRHDENDKESYKLNKNQILHRISTAKDISEIHIVGGLHKDYNLEFYTDLFKTIRDQYPNIHRKGLTAEEIKYIAELADKSIKETLVELINSGLESMPGGGAEIFDAQIRPQICPDKLTGDEWLSIHKTAHELGISTNATILYGHIESIEHRIDHLNQLRELQDKTGGFNAFIPLKYKLAKNALGIEKETPLIDDLRMFAISRIFLDNIAHIKAYWPMLGFDNALLMLSFGANDMDGTIAQSTKIYSSTGNISEHGITTNKLIDAITERGKKPIERDSLYNHI